MLTGQAKTIYQREYMRRYRAKKGDSAITVPKAGSGNAPGLRPVDELEHVRPVRPPESVNTSLDLVRPKVKSQSHNPMMVGYVPPGQEQ